MSELDDAVAKMREEISCGCSCHKKEWRCLQCCDSDRNLLFLTMTGFKDSFNECLRNLREVEAERDAARAELLAYGGFVTAASEHKSVSEVLSARLVVVERERDDLRQRLTRAEANTRAYAAECPDPESL